MSSEVSWGVSSIKHDFCWPQHRKKAQLTKKKMLIVFKFENKTVCNLIWDSIEHLARRATQHNHLMNEIKNLLKNRDSLHILTQIPSTGSIYFDLRSMLSSLISYETIERFFFRWKRTLIEDLKIPPIDSGVAHHAHNSGCVMSQDRRERQTQL